MLNVQLACVNSELARVRSVYASQIGPRPKLYLESTAICTCIRQIENLNYCILIIYKLNHFIWLSCQSTKIHIDLYTLERRSMQFNDH